MYHEQEGPTQEELNEIYTNDLWDKWTAATETAALSAHTGKVILPSWVILAIDRELNKTVPNVK